jgi:hypothetical protein
MPGAQYETQVSITAVAHILYLVEPFPQYSLRNFCLYYSSFSGLGPCCFITKTICNWAVYFHNLDGREEEFTSVKKSDITVSYSGINEIQELIINELNNFIFNAINGFRLICVAPI